MTKHQQLSEAAQVLTEDQIDGLIAYARYMRNEPVYSTASADLLRSLERCLADAAAGRVTPANAVFKRIDEKLPRASNEDRCSHR